MIDILPYLDTISGTDLLMFFVKSFAIVFSFMYLLYAVILTRQTQVLTKLLSDHYSNLFGIISFSQILLAIGLIVLSIFFI